MYEEAFHYLLTSGDKKSVDGFNKYISQKKMDINDIMLVEHNFNYEIKFSLDMSFVALELQQYIPYFFVVMNKQSEQCCNL